MALNCYTVFKDTYNQAIADGFSTAVATAAAQAAMSDCLSSQSTQQIQTAIPQINVTGTRLVDAGPVTARRTDKDNS